MMMMDGCMDQSSDVEEEYGLDLGSHTFPITTRSSACQYWFNKAINHCYGFSHEESATCFKTAIMHDPLCAMAHWGLAFVNGANYNSVGMMHNEEEAFKEAQVAMSILSKSMPEENGKPQKPYQTLRRDEQLLIEAIGVRYAWPMPKDEKQRSEKLNELNLAFAEKMKLAYAECSQQPDVCSIYAEALMDVRPWRLWEKMEDGSVHPNTLEIRRVLETTLKDHPRHPGLLHLYIHCMELSPWPELALGAADNLRNLVPDSGHLQHMPSHIDMWVGQYDKALEANARAVAADEKHVRVTGKRYNFFQYYRMHNYHFLAWAGMFNGQFSQAIAASRKIQEQVTPEAVAMMPQFLEAYTCVTLHVLIRFGKWHEVLAEPIPEDKELWAGQYATAHYARGMAYAALGKVEEADREYEMFLHALASPHLNGRVLHNNATKEILSVGKMVLLGELQYRKGKFDEAFQTLREAVRMDDALMYDEPWGWMLPVRHSLGALLTEQGHLTEAIALFNEDLKKYPNNMWSLRGLVECHRHNGDEVRTEEVQALLAKAAARCEVALNAPCFCAQVCGAAPPVTCCEHCDDSC